MDPLELPPDRLLNLVWHWLMRNRDEKERTKLISRLEMPLPGQKQVTGGVWDDENMIAVFEAGG